MHEIPVTLLDTKRAAEYLAVSDHFVRRLVRERRIPFIKIGKYVRFDARDLDEYIDSSRHTASR